MQTYPVVRFTSQGRDITTGVDAGPDVPTAGGPGRDYTVVYDGTCNVCKKLVRLLKEWDTKGKLEIIPSQTVGVQARFPWIPAGAYTESVQVVRAEDGKTWQGAAALEQLLKVLPKGCLFSWIFNIPLVRPLAERFYSWFARNRYKMGCGEHCAYKPSNIDFGDV